MPLTWDALLTAAPPDFTLASVAQRLASAGDAWRDALSRKQSLERTLALAEPPQTSEAPSQHDQSVH